MTVKTTAESVTTKQQGQPDGQNDRHDDTMLNTNIPKMAQIIVNAMVKLMGQQHGQNDGQCYT